MLCDAIDITLQGKWPTLLKRTEKKAIRQALIGHELLKHRSHAFLDDTAEFICGVKLLEEKLHHELQHLRRMYPTKHQSRENKTSTSSELSNCTVSRKRAAEGLLKLASFKKPKRNKKRCAVFWCNCTDTNCDLTRVPVCPSPLKDTKSVQRQINRNVKLFTRREYFDRLGLGRSHRGTDVRFCKCHPVESETFNIKMKINDNGMVKDITEKREIGNLPIPFGPKHFMRTTSKCVSRGLARDRLATRILNQSDQFALAHQQTVEMKDIESGMYELSDISPCVRAAAGLDIHCKENSSNYCKSMKSTTKTPNNKQKMRRDYARQQCTLTIDKLTAREVNVRTGFADIRDLLFFISIVCNGDFHKCIQNTSYMCWLEEWFFFFEMTYGHTANQWIHYEQLYQISKSVLHCIFKQKLNMILTTRSAWLLYASQGKDRIFRKEIWDHYFKQENMENVPRLVMHDNIDVPLMCPSDP